MRRKLQEIEEFRGTFTGVFVRMGGKRGYKGMLPTLLLKDVRNQDGEMMTDHLWFNFTKGFQKLREIREGDVIQFDARVKPYEKGYKGRRVDVYDSSIQLDYKLSHPTKISKVNKECG